MLRKERETDSWQSHTKLKKTKIGWKRLKPQQKIPDEMVRPKMEGSRAYVTPARCWCCFTVAIREKALHVG
jgi:hypothetical protein